jgi:hypothetical protein
MFKFDIMPLITHSTDWNAISSNRLTTIESLVGASFIVITQLRGPPASVKVWGVLLRQSIDRLRVPHSNDHRFGCVRDNSDCKISLNSSFYCLHFVRYIWGGPMNGLGTALLERPETATPSMSIHTDCRHYLASGVTWRRNKMTKTLQMLCWVQWNHATLNSSDNNKVTTLLVLWMPKIIPLPPPHTPCFGGVKWEKMPIHKVILQR